MLAPDQLLPCLSRNVRADVGAYIRFRCGVCPPGAVLMTCGGPLTASSPVGDGVTCRAGAGYRTGLSKLVARSARCLSGDWCRYTGDVRGRAADSTRSSPSLFRHPPAASMRRRRHGRHFFNAAWRDVRSPLNPDVGPGTGLADWPADFEPVSIAVGAAIVYRPVSISWPCVPWQS